VADTGFTIPTQAEVLARVKADLNAALGTQAAFIKGSLAWASAHAMAAATRGLYLYQRWIANQTIPDRATGAELLRWIRIWLGDKVAATAATGTLSVTGVAGSGPVTAGDTLTRADGEVYEVTGGPYNWATASTQDVTVEASVAGADGNYDYAVGASLVLVSPPPGIVADCPLKTGVDIDGGADEETDAEATERMLARIQDPPQGGAEADYVAWAQEASASVDRVWVQSYPDVTLGTVTVRFTAHGDGTDVIPTGVMSPPSGLIGTVHTYIEARRPVTATLTTAAPGNHAVTLDIELHILAGYDLTTVKAAIVNAVESAFRDDAEVDVAGDTIENSRIQAAIGSVEGVDYYVLSDVDGNGAAGDVDLLANEYPTLVTGDIVWT
jgi:uncharacterized phage protein gp47/JayE